jgi:hypothetical protein
MGRMKKRNTEAVQRTAPLAVMEFVIEGLHREARRKHSPARFTLVTLGKVTHITCITQRLPDWANSYVNGYLNSTFGEIELGLPMPGDPADPSSPDYEPNEG